MDRLLIIQQHQFGYLTDSYKWCEYLKGIYNIPVLCYDTGKPKVELSDVRVRYLKANGSRYTRGLKFIIMCLWCILQSKKSIIVYFEKCQILKCLLPFKKMILDIRTLSVHKNQEYRKKYNEAILKSCQYFDIVSIISEGIAKQLNLKNKQVEILPLGADIISEKHKDYSKLKLLYVGTFTNRDIDKTIEGFNLFIKRFPQTEISYDIVGDGNGNELDELKNIVSQKHLTKWIHFHGRIPYDKLSPFFDNSNIGISFVPKTEYFEDQPPTKTYEYVLSGLFVIATSTDSNKQIITSDNGVLIDDTALAFSDAIYRIYLNRNNINELNIRNSLVDSMWPNIVNMKLIPILNKLY